MLRKLNVILCSHDTNVKFIHEELEMSMERGRANATDMGKHPNRKLTSISYVVIAKCSLVLS